MALLPSGDSSVANSLTHANTTSAQQKTNFTAMRDFIADLLGTDSSNKKAARTALAVGEPLGQCRLAKSGANLVLSRFQGRYLTINGENYEIPAAGVSLAPTSLSVGVTYYIYAYMSGSTMTLEASATGHSTDTTTGVEIKTADATRTLVGMARTITGPAWQDSTQQRFVVSWFNRRRAPVRGVFTTDRSTSSATFVELHSEIRNEFLTWAGESVEVHYEGQVANSAINQTTTSGISFDGIATMEEARGIFQAYAAGAVGSTAMTVASNTLTEGYHYSTLWGLSSGGSVSSWIGSATQGARTNMKTIING